MARNGRHIEPLVLPTQLPSKSEDSDGEPGTSNDCNIKDNTISKETCFTIQEEEDLSPEGSEAEMESNVMAEAKQNVTQSYIILCHIHGQT